MKNIIIGLLAIAGIAFLILLLSPLMGGLHDFQTNNTTASFSVTLNASQTGANVTLPQPLYGNDIQYASATSNLSTDVPLVNSYASATKALEVTGLTASQNRTLTIVYDIGVLDSNVEEAAKLSPTIFMFTIIGLLLLAVVAAIIAVVRRNG